MGQGLPPCSWDPFPHPTSSSAPLQLSFLRRPLLCSFSQSAETWKQRVTSLEKDDLLPHAACWRYLSMCYAKRGTPSLPVRAKPAHVAQIPFHVQAVEKRPPLGHTCVRSLSECGELAGPRRRPLLHEHTHLPSFFCPRISPGRRLLCHILLP